MWAVLSWETWSVNVNSPALINGLQEGVLWIQPHHVLLDGCHPCVCMPSRSSRVQLFVTPMDCSPWGSSVHGILQARILEWLAISSSRGSSQFRDPTWVSCISHTAGGFFPAEPPGKPLSPSLTFIHSKLWIASCQLDGQSCLTTYDLQKQLFFWILSLSYFVQSIENLRNGLTLCIPRVCIRPTTHVCYFSWNGFVANVLRCLRPML